MNRLHYYFRVLLLFCLSTAAYGADKRVALVVGINQYDNLGDHAALHVAVEDAQNVANTLRSLPKPFDVDLITDGDHDKISEAFDNFVTAAKSAECALFYFAGHGIEYFGENYLLVRDTKINWTGNEGESQMIGRLNREALSLNFAISLLDETDAQMKIIILDSCRDNPLQKPSGGAQTRSLGKKRGLGEVKAPAGMLISYAAAAGEQANDGLFTGILCEKMKIPGLDIMKTFARTRDTVSEHSKILSNENRGVFQLPAEYNILNESALDFAFTPGTAPVPMAGGKQNPLPEYLKMLAAVEKELADNGAKLTVANNQLSQAQKKLTGVEATMKSEQNRYLNANDVINAITKNRTVPVQEGTVNYFKCVQSKNIMDEAAAKAPGLKAQKKQQEAEVEKYKNALVPLDAEQKRLGNEKKRLDLLIAPLLLEQ